MSIDRNREIALEAAKVARALGMRSHELALLDPTNYINTDLILALVYEVLRVALEKDEKLARHLSKIIEKYL